MHFRQRFNNVLSGVAAGLIVPIIAFMVFFLITRHGLSLSDYYRKIVEAGNITSIMSIAVFANIIIFLLFNRFDMLRALKGVLGITIVWAFVVFGIKLFEMKYFIIAGEPSGDLHGSNLVKNLYKADPDADIACWGGELIKSAGARLLKHYNETAFMGVWEVLVNIRQVQSNFRECRRQLTEMKPDVLILIDYPGFNLRMARYAKESGIRVFYYISPKFWAWREGRVKKIKQFVDRLYIIFPFEQEFFRRHDYHAIYLGNPLADHVEGWLSRAPGLQEIRHSLDLDSRPAVALLAGSRLQEVNRILPVMAAIAPAFPHYQFVVAAMDHLPAELYRRCTEGYPVKIITGMTYELLALSTAALVTSGTATLEAALFNVPQVVCYSTSPLTYHLAKWFIRVRFISLVNLIMEREVVKELIQGDLNQERLQKELTDILPEGSRHAPVLNDYDELRSVMGGSGASVRVAKDMADNLNSKK